jgi:uncharacterized protein YbcV (DUF1398 family)
MTTTWQDLAQQTLDGSESGAMTFGQSTQILTDAGFDGYAVDFRRNTRTYYLPSGETLPLPTEPTSRVAERFDAETIREALREAQQLIPGYTYRGFCAKAAAAGCAGYVVSFLGKRVLYYGRTGESHTEYFPGTQPATNERQRD